MEWFGYGPSVSLLLRHFKTNMWRLLQRLYFIFPLLHDLHTKYSKFLPGKQKIKESEMPSIDELLSVNHSDLLGVIEFDHIDK